MRLKFHDEASRLLLAAMLIGAGSAAAQDYPPATEAAVLSGWLGDNTNIPPADVVSVTPELVVALVGKTPPTTPGGPVRLTLREEVIAPNYVQTVGGRSSLMSMEIHCEERRIRMDERRLYAGLNLTGAVEISDPSAEWVRIPEGSIMDEVARAACDAEYPWPLRSAGAAPAARGVTVAALDTPAPVLPPGPDARLIEDEPPPAEVQVMVTPVPEPEVVPATETAVEAAPEVEPVPAPEQVPAAPIVEPAIETEIAVLPAPEELVAPSSVEIVPAAEPVTPETAPPADIQPPEQPSAPEIAAPADLPPPAEVTSAPEPEPDTPAPPAGPVFAVQIGAYETREMAQAAWAALSVGRPILVQNLGFEIRPVRVRGKDWLRGLVGPFATRKDAGAFCTAIAGGEYGCILRTLAG